MMTVDDALKLAEDVQNHGEKRSNSLSGQALAALAGEVRLLRADGYRRGMEDMRELCLCQCSAVQLTSTKEGAASAHYIEKLISAIKTEGEL